MLSWIELNKKARVILSQVRRFTRDAAGATAVLFSLGTVVVMGSIAFGVDAANWYQTDRRLQTGTDLAAIAAASSKTLNTVFEYQGESLTEVATGELRRDGVNTTMLTNLEVNSPPTSGAYVGDNNAVEVITTQDVQIFFAGLFVETTPQAQARAVARTSWTGNYCILTLDPDASGAVTFSGSASAFLGCGIASNSNAANSVYAGGASTVQTTVVNAVGGIDDNGSIITPVSMQEYANPIANPYADLVVPAAAPCDYHNVSASGTVTLSPGVYCGDLRVNGNVTFSPGTYVLDGADFVINSGADAYGDDVTFIFTNSPNATNVGRTRFNGNASIDFTASSSGTYAGILFMQDPNTPNSVGNNSQTWIVNGNSSSSFSGVIYVPSNEVELSGSASFSNGCIQVVSGAVTISGNFDVTQQCNDPNQRSIESLTVTLVE